MTRVEFINTFNSFPQKEKVLIAKQIQTQMADVLFEELDRELPDEDISMAEIVREVKAHRNAQKKKA